MKTLHEITRNPTYAYELFIEGKPEKEKAYKARLNHEMKFRSTLQDAIKYTYISLVQSKIIEL